MAGLVKPAMATMGANPGSAVSAAALETADMLLGIQLKPDAVDQVELSLEEIDVIFLILHHALEQVARDVILDGVAVGCGFLVQQARGDLGGEIAFDDFLYILADSKRIEHLHV